MTDETSRSLELRLRTAEQLLEVAATVGRKERVGDILDALFDGFRHLVPYDRMEYAAITGGGSVLETKWVRATYQPVLLDVGFSYRRTVGGGFAATGSEHPYIETETIAYADTRPPGHPAHLLVAEGIQSGLCCPLMLEGSRVGYLFFCSRTADAYDDFHLWVMTRIAGVAAGALAMGELREELAARNRELEELASFRTRYLATVSHELRTPLTAVVGLAESIREGFDSFDRSELRELIEVLAEQSADTAGIVDDLLLVARAENGNLPVANQEIDLGSLARAVVAAIDPGLRVEGSARGHGDPVRVRQIVRNLVTNARKHGGPEAWLEIGSDGDSCWVSVVDDGEGVGPADASVFLPFVTSSSRPESAGIGLWVSAELAKRMGGSLEYARADGVSRFTLTLPARAPSAERTGGAAAGR